MLASQLAERAFLNFQLFGEKKQYLFMDREEEEEKIPLTLRRASSLRLPSRRTFKDGELNSKLQSGGSLRIPEYLAKNLLQLGCPIVSIPQPRAGVGTENLPSSDSDDSSTMQNRHVGHHQGQSLGRSQSQPKSTGIPKVEVSEPEDSSESLTYVDGSAGSIGARSAPNTPLQGNVVGTPPIGQTPISGIQLAIPPSPKSPNHSASKGNESQLSKPLSKSTPSMTADGNQTPASISRTSSKSSPAMSISNARQKKFHRHFSQSSKFCGQVASDERVLNYYSCALVGDILLQGHLYITPNYFAFYSNVFGYITKLLIPTISVVKITKEKTARIIPNAVAVSTEENRHVFCSLLSRDTTYKLMIEVWEAAMESLSVIDALPLPVTEDKIVVPEVLLVDESEIKTEEDDSSMSESGTDITSRSPTICTDTDGHSPTTPSLQRLEQEPLLKQKVLRSSMKSSLGSIICGRFEAGTIIAILVALLAALYVSAALMMLRIDKLHSAYVNHPLSTSERFTQDRLVQYLNINLEQITKVRRSLQILSQQIISMNPDSESESTVTRGPIEPEESPS
ncbi:GRAM domain-containing protein 2B-like isoform X2 [Leptopilina boulardi]|uniref:GRAM domain-containing protein 2B-like isoform X2 n=1 Tax=Leptopilina boulardi TaxID=63433 RepID=UPI0021F5ADB1|nr:GRAM domain-containing protein 2B-like isoform X2 [Leptopilina boulardi]